MSRRDSAVTSNLALCYSHLETIAKKTQRKLLFLKFYEEKTDAEIANLLGLSQEAVSKTKRL